MSHTNTTVLFCSISKSAWIYKVNADSNPGKDLVTEDLAITRKSSVFHHLMMPRTKRCIDTATNQSQTFPVESFYLPLTTSNDTLSMAYHWTAISAWILVVTAFKYLFFIGNWCTEVLKHWFWSVWPEYLNLKLVERMIIWTGYVYSTVQCLNHNLLDSWSASN